MKRVEAIIRPGKLRDVREALVERGVEGFTFSEVDGVGRGTGHTESFRGAVYEVDHKPMVKLEVVVRDEHALTTAYAISDVARMENAGDEKVVIVPVDEIVRIRTNERGIAAIGKIPARPMA